MSYISLGRLEEGVENMAMAVQTNPGFSVLHVFLTAGYGISGQAEQARDAGRRVLEIVPDFTISAFVRADFLGPQRMVQLADGLRVAGLPE